MALGAGDAKLFRELMAILKDVNPSAYQAIICLKGTSAALLELETLHPEMAKPGANELLRPSVACSTGKTRM